MNTIDLPLNHPQVSLESLMWNLLLCTILAGILCWHYYIRAQKKYLRRDLALVLPVICLTTLLVITVVKSSLALSLGLVGALSIVRFRTPIKEPEELAYIFLAIAIGLALGADQREVAAIALVFILFVISIIDRFKKNSPADNSNLLLTIEVKRADSEVKSVIEMLESITLDTNIRRVDQAEDNLSIVAHVNLESKEDLVKFSFEFQEKFPTGSFSLIDDSCYPNE
jgi:signal transduction histidine kinase